jgi:hypothetical protein
MKQTGMSRLSKEPDVNAMPAATTSAMMQLKTPSVLNAFASVSDCTAAALRSSRSFKRASTLFGLSQDMYGWTVRSE